MVEYRPCVCVCGGGVVVYIKKRLHIQKKITRIPSARKYNFLYTQNYNKCLLIINNNHNYQNLHLNKRKKIILKFLGMNYQLVIYKKSKIFDF